MSQQSVSRAISEVTGALNPLTVIVKWIKFPQNQEEREILKKMLVLILKLYLYTCILIPIQLIGICTYLVVFHLIISVNFILPRFYEKYGMSGIIGCVDGMGHMWL